VGREIALGPQVEFEGSDRLFEGHRTAAATRSW
jgi:hypothetical protein